MDVLNNYPIYKVILHNCLATNPHYTKNTQTIIYVSFIEITVSSNWEMYTI